MRRPRHVVIETADPRLPRLANGLFYTTVNGRVRDVWYDEHHLR
jgi:hypothetical protein